MRFDKGSYHSPLVAQLASMYFVVGDGCLVGVGVGNSAAELKLGVGDFDVNRLVLILIVVVQVSDGGRVSYMVGVLEIEGVLETEIDLVGEVIGGVGELEANRVRVRDGVKEEDSVLDGEND